MKYELGEDEIPTICLTRPEMSLSSHRKRRWKELFTYFERCFLKCGVWQRANKRMQRYVVDEQSEFWIEQDSGL